MNERPGLLTPSYNEGHDYKYAEDELLAELHEYIEKTYGQHYSQNRFQATEFIVDSGMAQGFLLGNVMKYAQRYGRKGKPEDWRKDLFKVIHYTMMMVHAHDTGQGAKE